MSTPFSSNKALFKTLRKILGLILFCSVLFCSVMLFVVVVVVVVVVLVFQLLVFSYAQVV